MHYASLVSGITNGNMKNKLGYMKKYTPIAISCLTGPGIDDPKATCLRIINYIKKNIAKTQEETGKTKIHEEETVQEMPDGKVLVVSKMWVYWEDT